MKYDRSVLKVHNLHKIYMVCGLVISCDFVMNSLQHLLIQVGGIANEKIKYEFDNFNGKRNFEKRCFCLY